VQKITIVPRGRAGGYVLPLPEDRMVVSREFFEDKIAMTLGGRAAEEVFFGRVTTGASNDLQQATRWARSMIMEYGMSKELGLPTYGSGGSSPFLGREMAYMGSQREYSEEAAKAIDSEVKQILESGYQTALVIIRENREKLVKLAKSLIEQETLDRDVFESLMVDMPVNKPMAIPA
jgi:cell division protease FtsH